MKAILLTIALLTAACASNPQKHAPAEAKRYYFAAKSQVSSMAAIQAALIEEVGIKTEGFKQLQGFSSHVTREQLEQIKAQYPDLEAHEVPTASIQPEREFVVPCEASKEPPPEFKTPWGIEKMGAPDVHKITQGEGVLVAVVDTGVDLNHPALKDRVKICKGIGNVCQDDNGHGTHVAGTIAAASVDGKGIIGMAPKADLAIYKGLNQQGQGTFDVLSDLIAQACADGANVVNNSWGGRQGFPPLEAVIKACQEKGVMVVSAAGNEGGKLIYPALYSTPVGAVNEQMQKAGFSNFGPEMIERKAVVAPGIKILSTCLGGGYCEKQGTSMAAPHVAGAEALRIAAELAARAGVLPSLCADKLAGVKDEHQGLGFVNLEKCIQ